MTTAKPKKDKKDKRQKRQKRHLFVYIAQRTPLKIFERVRDEALKNIFEKVKYFSCKC